MSKKVLVFVAHQDDETIGCGGTIAKWSSRGDYVDVCFMTDGSTGIEQDTDGTNIVLKRSSEADRACALLGVNKVHSLGIACQEIKNDKQTFHKVIAKIREIKPDIVITHNTVCKHRDHKNTSVVVQEACWKSSENILEELGPTHNVSLLMSCEILDPFENPDYIVDVTESYETKIQAMSIYSSQRGVIPGVEDYLDGISKVRGYNLGPGKRAEAFKRLGNSPLEI